MAEFVEINNKWMYSEEFLDQYKDVDPPWGPLGWVVYKRTYARWVEEEQRTEKWWETCRRVLEGNYNLTPDDPTITQQDMEQAYEHMFNMRWLPAGRGLWMSGTKLAAKVGAALINCWGLLIEPKPYYNNGPIKTSTPFVFAMDRLMLGGGVGYSVSEKYTKNFRKVSSKVNLVVVCDPMHLNIAELDAHNIPPRDQNHLYIRVDDSRRGWTDALRVVIDASFKRTKYDRTIILDVSDIRPSGTRIQGFGGVASGPGPLVRMLRSVNLILNETTGNHLTNVQLSDIVGNVAKCVVAGGVRRSATLGLGDSSDIFFRNMKLDQDKLMEVRWTANISVSIDDSFKGYEELVEAISTNGEPGIINLERSQNYGRFIDGYQKGIDEEATTVNPCFTGSQLLLTDRGYKSFYELYLSEEPVNVLTDPRISYIDSPDGKPHPENWVIDLSKKKDTAILRKATHVSLTREDTPVFKVKTRNGYELVCTPDHKIATETGMVEARKLNENHKILISVPEAGESIVGRDPETEEEKAALLMGLIAGDGCYTSKKVSDNVSLDFWGPDRFRLQELSERLISDLYELDYQKGNCKEGVWSSSRTLVKSHTTQIDFSNKTRITSIWLANYLAGEYNFTKKTKQVVPSRLFVNSTAAKFYLAGMFYADGTVNANENGRSTYVRLGQSHEVFLKEIQLILQLNGVFSRLFSRRPAGLNSLPDGRGGMKDYYTKETFDITISGISRFVFSDIIGFIGHPDKEDKLFQLNLDRPKKEYKLYSNFHSIENIGTKDVYCLTEPTTHSIIVNGLSVANCAEINLNGNKGECCNLAEVFPYFCYQDGVDPLVVSEFAYKYAKRVTFADYSDWEMSNEIVQKNRRIGISLSGWDDLKMMFTAEGRPDDYKLEWLDKMYERVAYYDESYSTIMECEPSIKLTTIKPSGSISQLRGASPGRHAHYFAYGKRRIRFSDQDTGMLTLLIDLGFYVEPDAYSPNTYVVEFPVKAPTADLPGFRSADDYTLEEQISDQMDLQTYWADNSVSSTLTFKPDEVDQIAGLLEKYKLKSTSLLPYSGHGYTQAPYEPTTKEEYELSISKLKGWPSEKLFESMQDANIDLIDLSDCEGGSCPIR